MTEWCHGVCHWSPSPTLTETTGWISMKFLCKHSWSPTDDACRLWWFPDSLSSATMGLTFLIFVQYFGLWLHSHEPQLYFAFSANQQMLACQHMNRVGEHGKPYSIPAQHHHVGIVIVSMLACWCSPMLASEIKLCSTWCLLIQTNLCLNKFFPYFHQG